MTMDIDSWLVGLVVPLQESQSAMLRNLPSRQW